MGVLAVVVVQPREGRRTPYRATVGNLTPRKLGSPAVRPSRLKGKRFVHPESHKIRVILESKLKEVLKRHGMPHLTIEKVRSKDRDVTRAISRAVYDTWDSAGIEFQSYLDKETCYALFEGRSKLRQVGRALSLEIDLPPLIEVCEQFGLSLN